MRKYNFIKSKVKKGTSVKFVGPDYEFPPRPDAATGKRAAERTGYRRSHSTRKCCEPLLISGEIRIPATMLEEA